MLNNPNIIVSSYCSFIPGGAYNTITGNIRIDSNSNGCDTNDIPASGLPIKVSQFGNTIGSLFVTNNGSYLGYLPHPDITLTPQFTNPYFTVEPGAVTPIFVGSGNVSNVDFCIVPNGIHPDLAISLVPLTPARPGFDAEYKLIYSNKGTITQSGNISCNFPDDVFDFVSANPVAANTPNTLSWSFNDLQPFQSREITFKLNLNSPAEVPPVNFGQHLNLYGAVSSSSADENNLDNTANLTQIVSGSNDPNDMQVSTLLTHIEPPLEYLTYTIRFQNTGDSAAENVVVADILDDRFDRNSLEMVSASHSYVSRLFGNRLEVIFQGINLPDLNTDEPQSHGYVSFKVKPKLDGVNVGDNIENKANIFFDFNLPVTTNTVTTTYNSILLGAEKFDRKLDFNLYPNPVKNSLNIDVNATASIKSVQVYNMLGQLLKTVSNITKSKTILVDVTQLNAGTYLLEIVSDKGKTTKKFMKL